MAAARAKTQRLNLDIVDEAEAFASEFGLRYVHDYEPGYTRRVSGRGFIYLDVAGRKAKASETARIEKLVIPPAWQAVWICRYANGHLQATGRDQRGRKQYRYHEKWTLIRNETKFEGLKRLAALLPRLRSRVARDLRRPGLPKEKVIAAVVRLLELTQIRIGNEEYAETNNSYGLTTILNRHARVHGSQIAFRFRGKSGVPHEVSLRDPRLSRIIRTCQNLPGQDLFEYLDDEGVAHKIGSVDVNQYLKEATGGAITAKDLRTWSGTVKALETLFALGPAKGLSERERKKRELHAIRETSAHLRNTVAVCRKYYIHPKVFEADRAGWLHRSVPVRRRGLSSWEQRLAALL